MYALFLELARTGLFLSNSPHTFRLRMISSTVVLAPYGEVAKTLSMVVLATHKLIVFVDGFVGVATTHAGKHMATVLPTFVLAKHFKRLESLVTDIIFFFSCTLSPYTDPIQQQHDFPYKPALPAVEYPSSCAP